MKIRTNSDVIRQFIMSALNILQNKIRIVIFKSLNESDVEFLKSINPFFEEEYKLYGIDITPEFIVEEINKQH